MDWKAVILLAAAVGCGGADGTSSGGTPVTPPADPLLGTWALQSGVCAVGYTFSAASAYEFDLVCPTTNGGLGLELETGTYASTATRITFTVSDTTCAGDPAAYFLAYTFPAVDRLSLTFADGIEVLAKTVPSGTGVAAFGCWRMGAFTTAPLAPP